MEKARIFNIERCSNEDGPGLRTVVFMKGCTLRCKWCANPESQSFAPEILFKSVRCISCGKCIKICPENAISLKEGFGMITDSSKCKVCGACIDNCYADSRVLQGKDYTVIELMKELEKDDAYYKHSGGGITFSGGEPLLQVDFIVECAKEIHKKGWNVLIETCGAVPIENFEKVIDYVDIIYCDFKHYSSEEHKKLTGSGNELIINNINYLDKNFKGKLYLRYPFIPHCNDEKEAIENFLDFAENLQSVDTVTFLPYHRLGYDKYIGLGRKYEMGDFPSLKIKDLKFLKEYEKKYNLKINIQ